MARRRSLWSTSNLNSAVVDGTRIVNDIGSGLRTLLGIDSLAGYTMVRQILNLMYKPTLVGSGHVRMAVGITKATEVAISAGQGSLPAPTTQGHDWAFLDELWVPNNGNEQAAGTFTTWSQVRSFDSRSMRKLGNNESIVALLETVSAAATIGISSRTLWLIP